MALRSVQPWGRVVSRLHSNHREYADLTSEVIQAIHSYKGEQDELDATSGRWGLEARTVSMCMCDKYSIYPPQSKFGEPLYGGRLETLADIDDYRPVRACRWCEYRTLISVAYAYRFSPSLPRTRRTAEVFRCEARQAGRPAAEVLHSGTYSDVLLSLWTQGRKACLAWLGLWRCGQAVHMWEAGGGSCAEEDELDGLVGEGRDHLERTHGCCGEVERWRGASSGSTRVEDSGNLWLGFLYVAVRSVPPQN